MNNLYRNKQKNTSTHPYKCTHMHMHYQKYKIMYNKIVFTYIYTYICIYMYMYILVCTGDVAMTSNYLPIYLFIRLCKYICISCWDSAKMIHHLSGPDVSKLLAQFGLGLKGNIGFGVSWFGAFMGRDLCGVLEFRVFWGSENPKAPHHPTEDDCQG